jgi:hypothetical protein
VPPRIVLRTTLEEFDTIARWRTEMRFPQERFSSHFCVVLFALPVLTQSPNGTINGLVNDSSNSVIPEADIVVVNDATKPLRCLVPTPRGRMPRLSPPSKFRLETHMHLTDLCVRCALTAWFVGEVGFWNPRTLGSWAGPVYSRLTIRPARAWNFHVPPR